MLPSHTITICTLSTIDAGHQIGQDNALPVGAAVMSGHVRKDEVSFELATMVLSPSDPVEDLLLFLGRHLADERATLAAYRPDQMLAQLKTVQDANRYTAIRVLGSLGRQQVVQLISYGKDGSRLSFQQACARAKIACAPSDPTERFTAWVRSDTDRIAADLEIDAIANWRMIMNLMAGRTTLGGEVAQILQTHLVDWLRARDTAASRLHLHEIETIAN